MKQSKASQQPTFIEIYFYIKFQVEIQKAVFLVLVKGSQHSSKTYHQRAVSQEWEGNWPNAFQSIHSSLGCY